MKVIGFALTAGGLSILVGLLALKLGAVLGLFGLTYGTVILGQPLVLFVLMGIVYLTAPMFIAGAVLAARGD